MATETTPEQHEDGDLKGSIRAAGERDYTPAEDRRADEAADGADRVRAAEGIALFQGFNGNGHPDPGEQTQSPPAPDGSGKPKKDGHRRKSKRNGNGHSNGNSNGNGGRDPWLVGQLEVVQPGYGERGRRISRRLLP